MLVWDPVVSKRGVRVYAASDSRHVGSKKRSIRANTLGDVFVCFVFECVLWFLKTITAKARFARTRGAAQVGLRAAELVVDAALLVPRMGSHCVGSHTLLCVSQARL